MDLLIGIVLFTVLSSGLCGPPDRKTVGELTVRNGGHWGRWGRIQFCPTGFANGFSVKTTPYKGKLAWEDDTGLDGLRLHCTDGAIIQSAAWWGTWSNVQKCSRGNLLSFSLKVSKPQGILDDTAANNIRFMCEGGQIMTGNGHTLQWGKEWGEWGEWSSRCARGSVCGIQTKLEPTQGFFDDTGLNDVKLICCE